MQFNCCKLLSADDFVFTCVSFHNFYSVCFNLMVTTSPAFCNFWCQ
uniref:Uncharacterized protein n=1 Tax=Rhizophora mucronata TaxID=61149 RepID=A0A2P2PCH9_RHIMU